MASYGSIPAEETDAPAPDTTVNTESSRAPWRQELGEKLESNSVHWAVLWLTILDSLCVLIEIIVTFFEECTNEPADFLLLMARPKLWDHWAVETAEWVSTGITCLFLIEVLLTLVSFGPSYYAPGNSHWIMHNLDAAGKAANGVYI
jgi:hypothetical protein